jgi:hypothetical protein
VQGDEAEYGRWLSENGQPALASVLGALQDEVAATQQMRAADPHTQAIARRMAVALVPDDVSLLTSETREALSADTRAMAAAALAKRRAAQLYGCVRAASPSPLGHIKEARVAEGEGKATILRNRPPPTPPRRRWGGGGSGADLHSRPPPTPPRTGNAGAEEGAGPACTTAPLRPRRRAEAGRRRERDQLEHGTLDAPEENADSSSGPSRGSSRTSRTSRTLSGESSGRGYVNGPLRTSSTSRTLLGGSWRTGSRSCTRRHRGPSSARTCPEGMRVT